VEDVIGNRAQKKKNDSASRRENGRIPGGTMQRVGPVAQLV